ncbi:regenerating islet-derived protein 3-gamma-like [Phyllostomus discolor]|uniref:Regenerating islet-derived protein 3-gamma-like n=1 Tax=Phyllostomus discolor TaxID=89673 RepID=A0A6J2LSG7_9CHIR|nr:regenerating islet-derived protein 3-gamma-like [Phyllostomus discolor]XP_028370256.1 regenerating islet-derived protein 3-gamma-like [Phyllostomus discolor]
MLPPVVIPSMSWMLLSCLMLLSQVQGEDSEKELPFPRSSCPKGSYTFASHCYAIFTSPKSWFDADIACQKRPSGFLVSVLNRPEASFLASVIKRNLKNSLYVWIGLHDPTQGFEPNAGGWEWSNNDVMNYVAWEKNPATITNSAFCGSLSQSSGYLSWKDYDCNQQLPYICKFKA